MVYLYAVMQLYAMIVICVDFYDDTRYRVT